MNVPDGNKPIKVGDPSFIYKGVYHPIVWHGNDPYRPRVETLVIKDRSMIYAHLRIQHDDIINTPPDIRDHFYSIPGGSLDIDSTMLEQAEAETNEEALISIKNIYPTGIQYYEQYEKGFLLKGGDMPLEYVGSISYVFIAEYDGPYDKSKVEEKDLDPDMAEKGKFHPINSDIKHLLREEHVRALLMSPYVDIDSKIHLMRDARFVVGESLDPSKMGGTSDKIYHGSIHKIETFKPMSLDLGNSFQTPGWSTFCFLDKRHAKLFGTMRALQQLLQSTDITSDEQSKKELSVEILDEQLVVSEDCIRLIKDTELINTPIQYYVYTIDSSNLNVSIGNDPYLPEVTFREEGVVPIKTECFKTSILELREEIGLLQDSITNIDNYRKPKNGYAEYLTHNYRTESVRKDLEKAVRDKKLNPGDDIQEYMVANDLFFDSDDIHLPDMVLEIDEPVMEVRTPILEKKYPLECYGLPNRKAYPMPDEQHVRSAIRFFNYVDADEERELATNINKKIQQFHITNITLSENNRFRKYYIPKKKSSIGKKIQKGSKPKKSTRIMETTHISGKKSKNYKPKERLLLTRFSKIKGTAKVLKEDYPALLMHVKDSADVIIWINQDSDKPVGYIATIKKTDGIWIVALEVSKKYRSHGLSKQMIDVAIKECGATKLSVAKTNKIAYDIYTQSFTVYDETDYVYFMKIVNEAYAIVDKLLNPVLEAGDTEEEEEDTGLDEPAEEYANDVEDEPAEDVDNEDVDTTDGSDTGASDMPMDESEEPLGGEPTDYSEDVDGELSEDNNDTNEEESTDTEPDETQDNISSEDTEEDDKNKSRFDNRELKNYFLLNDFLSVRELIIDTSESTNGLILRTPEANQILAKVIKTIQDIQTFIENFVQFQFSDTDYKFNLYYYNLIVTTLKMNLEVLQKIMNFEKNK